MTKASPSTVDINLIRSIYDTVLRLAGHGHQEFITEIAKLASQQFHAKCVIIWDNNHYSKELVFLAGYPDYVKDFGPYVVSRKEALTGMAVDRCELILHNLTKQDNKRCFTHAKLITEHNISHMLSLPIPLPFNFRLITMVINLLFDRPPNHLDEMKQEVEWFMSGIGLSLDYALHIEEQEIRYHVSDALAQASGITRLFEKIFPELTLRTKCTDAVLWSSNKGVLEQEASSFDFLQRDGKIVPEYNKYFTDCKELIVKQCIKRRLPFVTGVSKKSIFPICQKCGISSDCVVVPIVSPSDKVLGVLHCIGQRENENSKKVFSSLDVEVVVAFASGIAPAIEKFYYIREHSVLNRVITNILMSIAAAHELDDILKVAIETAVESFHAEVGSIYLVEDNGEILRMRAASGKNENLIGNAAYKIGEGLTGTIAEGEGQVLIFANKHQILSHPKWLGKYDDRIWPEVEGNYANTFLGMPIVGKDKKIMGIWKISNIKKFSDHPEAYFTDEDIQTGWVLSAILAYAITNFSQRKRDLQRFNLLAENSTAIVRSRDEEEAIIVVLETISSIGFPDALFSYYNPESGNIIGFLSVGSKWKICENTIIADMSSKSILTDALHNDERLFRLTQQDLKSESDKKVAEKCKVVAQYIMPLRLDNEYIGVIQVDAEERKKGLESSDILILNSLASHLAITISRIRSVRKLFEFTSQVMGTSRFIAAEMLSSLAVHSAGHKIDAILDNLKHDLKNPKVRENRFLLEKLEEWYGKLSPAEQELRNALEIVKVKKDQQLLFVDLHKELNNTIGKWISAIRYSKVNIKTNFKAEISLSRIESYSLHEIISVLLVNSIQAYAKNIQINTHNVEDIQVTPQLFIQRAICIEFCDDGIGLATDNSEEVFESTYTTKPDKFGTGLGLFIARKLSEQAGGHLQVSASSNKKRGVTFELILPCRKETGMKNA